MALSASQVKRWKARLRHARDIWVKMGILGTSSPSTMREMIAYYAGEQWPDGTWKCFEAEDLVTVNKMYATTNASVAQLAGRNPEVQLIARRESAREAAPKVESWLQYDIEEQNHIRQWNRVLFDQHFAPIAGVRYGFTPPAEMRDEDGRLLEFYRPARPGKPWLKRLSPWDFLIDPLAESFHPDGGARWCAFRDMRPVSWFRRNPNMIRRDNIRPNVSSEFKKMRPKELDDTTNEDFQDLVEFWWVYEIEERTWFALTIDDDVDKPLRDEDAWPIEWEHLPLDVLAIHEQMNTPFAKPLMEECMPIFREINRLYTIASRISLSTRRVIAMTEAGVEEEEVSRFLDGEVNEVLRINGVDARTAIAEIKAGGFPQELLAYIALLEQNIREIKGQSLMDRAQRINVESATEANAVDRGSAILGSKEQAAFEEFMGRSVRNHFQGLKQTMTSEELVPLLGEAGAMATEPFLTVTPEDVREDFDFRLVAGSSLAPQKGAEEAKALADIQVAAAAPDLHNLPEVYKDYWLKRRKNPERVLVHPREQQQSDALATQRGRAAEPGANAPFAPQLVDALRSQGAG